MTEITPDILNSIRLSTCAIGILKVTVQSYLADPRAPDYEVLGTGFLVRPATVITNRHVVKALRTWCSNVNLPGTSMYLQFTYPHLNSRGWGTMLKQITAMGSAVAEDVDIGIIEFTRSDADGDFGQCQPVQLGDTSKRVVGRAIAACGYPYGTAMLLREQRVYRFGPVLQQGHISALSPYDAAETVLGLLLDMRAAVGMSGSPVFYPEDGMVIGIISSQWEATTSIAVPLDSDRVSRWLVAHDAALASDGSGGQAQPAQPATGAKQFVGDVTPRSQPADPEGEMPSGSLGPVQKSEILKDVLDTEEYIADPPG